MNKKKIESVLAAARKNETLRDILHDLYFLDNFKGTLSGKDLQKERDAISADISLYFKRAQEVLKESGVVLNSEEQEPLLQAVKNNLRRVLTTPKDEKSFRKRLKERDLNAILTSTTRHLKKIVARHRKSFK